MLCSSPHSHGKERNNQNQDKNRVNAGFLIGRFDLLFRNGFFNHAALELETAFRHIHSEKLRHGPIRLPVL